MIYQESTIKEASSLVREGNALASQGDLEGAIEKFLKSIELVPTYSEAYLGLGMFLEEVGDLENALKCYTKAIYVDPDWAWGDKLIGAPYYMRGLLRAKLGDFYGAIEDLGKRIGLSPNDASAYTRRGAFLFKVGKCQESIADFNKSIQLNPNDWLSYDGRSKVYIKLEEYEKALCDIDKLLEINPENAGAYYRRGACLLYLDVDKKVIINDFMRACNLAYEQGDSKLQQEAMKMVNSIGWSLESI